MDRVLLLMTTRTYRAAAFLEAARRLGAAVVVGSDRSQSLGDAVRAGHITLDFSAPEAAARDVERFARRHPIGAVVAADDEGVLLAAHAAAALGLPRNGVEAVAAARNKFSTRRLLAAAGLLSPPFEKLPVGADPRAAACTIGFPCVLKPLTLAGSRGVMRADDPDGFVRAFRRIAAILERSEPAMAGDGAGHVLVEGFIEGAEVALEGLLSAGRLRCLALYDKPDRLEGPFFEESIYVTPSRHPAAVQAEAVACTSRAVAALGLREGPVHVELRLNRAGAWVLEVAPRSIGGLCSRTLRFGESSSLEELILRQALGIQTAALEREECAAGVMMIPIPAAGFLREVRGQGEACRVAGVEDVRITIPVGHEVVPLPEGARYLGFIFARGETPDDVERSLREAHRRLAFVISAAPRGD